ncbi:hypothetical protein [Vibrio sp. R78045]|uniref:hypothetical protein n=1 Tax=Vibrio sp. R78045 TaxID=3093868 RepID=UPI0036F194D9
MASCCDVAVTRFILVTAFGFLGEQHGEDFARRLICEAGISLDNKDDAKIIADLGDEFLKMVKALTRA